MSNSKSNKSQAKANAKASVSELPENVTELGISITRERFQSTYGMVALPSEDKGTVASVSKMIPVLDGEGDEVFDRTDGRQLFKHIVNLKVIPRQHIKAVREMWKGRNELDLAYLNGKTLSINVIVPASGDVNLPFKGQDVSFKTDFLVDKDTGDYKTNDDGQKILIVTGYNFPELTKATNFSLDDEIELPELDELEEEMA